MVLRPSLLGELHKPERDAHGVKEPTRAGPSDDKDPVLMTGSSLPPKARYEVLLIDDDPVFLVTLEAILSASFDITCCGSSEEAQKLDVDRFHVVCCDYNMPGMNGLELLTRVFRRHPAVCCLLMTGADDFFDVVKHAAHRPPVIFKPVDPERMTHTVAHLASIAAMKRSTAVMADVSGPPSSTRAHEGEGRGFSAGFGKRGR